MRISETIRLAFCASSAFRTFLPAMILICAGAAFAASKPTKAKVLKLTGTFSSLEYNRAGGDLTGFEFRIVPGRAQHFGLLQFSEGEPVDPILGEIKWINRETGEFEMSVSQPKEYEGKLRGKVEAKALIFHFDYKSGGKENATLKRKASYWD